MWTWFVQSFGFYDFTSVKTKAVTEGKSCWDNWEGCKAVVGAEDSNFVNKGRIAVYTAYSGGTQGNCGSWMNLEQYVQNIRSEKFTRYDWGPEINMEKWG
jgi:hypothetical protein